MNKDFKKETFKKKVAENVKFLYRKKLEEATQEQLFQAVSYTVKDVIIDNWLDTQNAYDEQDPKTVYYMSMEFLMGRALGNNLINLGAYEEVSQALEELGLDINAIEDQEPDPALGNGGLGRLAACFLDSLATLTYPGSGNTIRYKNGLFKQLIENCEQVEVPDQWLRIENPWEVRKADKTVDVRFYGYVDITRDANGELQFHRKDTEHVLAVPYDMPIIGSNNAVANTLRMWNAEPSDDLPVGRDYRKYLSDVEDICVNLDPDDTTV